MPELRSGARYDPPDRAESETAPASEPVEYRSDATTEHLYFRDDDFPYPASVEPADDEESYRTTYTHDETFRIIRETFEHLFTPACAHFLLECGYDNIPTIAQVYSDPDQLNQVLESTHNYNDSTYSVPYARRTVIRNFFQWAASRSPLTVLAIRSLTSYALLDWVKSQPTPSHSIPVSNAPNVPDSFVPTTFPTVPNQTTPPAARPPSHASDFTKSIKRNISDFKELQQEKDFLDWHRAFRSQLTAMGLVDIIDGTYDTSEAMVEYQESRRSFVPCIFFVSFVLLALV